MYVLLGDILATF